MAHDKAFIEELFTAEERAQFAEAAKKREPAMRWDNLFPKRQDEIILPLMQENEVPKSIDADIEQVLKRHNEEAEKAVAAARAEGKNPGFKIRYCQLKRDPENPALLIVTHNGKEQNDRFKLGKFLDEKREWLLLDALEVELNRKHAPAKKTSAEQEPATLEKIANKDRLAADRFTPDSLRVVISRDPMQIAAMSTGRRWNSCMSKGSFHHDKVHDDIEQGTLVAYLVAKGDVHARHPLMRQLLKPFRNEKGETILVPGYNYGGEPLGNSASRTAMGMTLRHFVLNGVNKDNTGIFNMPKELYADGQATRIVLNTGWDIAALNAGLQKFVTGAVVEHIAEIRRGFHAEKHKNALLRLLDDPQYRARTYYRKLVNESLGGTLPSPADVLAASKTPTSLFVGNSKIGAEGAKALAANKTLTLLHASSNDIGDEGAAALAKNKTLTTLDVSKNRIRAKGAKALAANTTLTSLYVGGNNIGDEGAKDLAANKTLTSLYVTFNNIGDEGAKALAANTTLTLLDVFGNNIGAEGAKALVNTKNKNLLRCQYIGPYQDQMQALLANNRNEAIRLAEKIVQDASSLTADDKQEIAERRNAIREVTEEWDEPKKSAIASYLSGKEPLMTWQERVAPPEQKPKEAAVSTSPHIHLTSRYRPPRQTSRSGSGSYSLS